MIMGMGTPRKNRSSERIAASETRCLNPWSSVATPPAVSGRQAGAECTDEQRDEEPQCRIGGRLAALFSSVFRRGFRIAQLYLHACIRITHSLLCGLLRQTGALSDNLPDIPNVVSRHGPRANGVHEDAGHFGPGNGWLRSMS